MTPETIINILVECNEAVPQWRMVWNVREQRFELYLPSKENL